MMLTLCEDAINLAGQIPAETTGSYFRLVWLFGVPAADLSTYASKVWELHLANPGESRFPEWVLQELGQFWITEYPSSGEAGWYVANHLYVQFLLAKLGSGGGRDLERLAHYLLSCVPGFRAQMRMRSVSTDYDVVCAPEGIQYDFRSELGRYFLCESKDWKTPADVTVVTKFASVLRSAKCCFGMVFSKAGVTGRGKGTDAERELLKTYQSADILIVVFSEADLNLVANGTSFLSLLRQKYEQIRLDLPSPRIATGRQRRAKASG